MNGSGVGAEKFGRLLMAAIFFPSQKGDQKSLVDKHLMSIFSNAKGNVSL